jgi:succinyl-CoA synthetase beta subunit
LLGVDDACWCVDDVARNSRSPDGGVDIETVAEKNPERIFKDPVNIVRLRRVIVWQVWCV